MMFLGRRPRTIAAFLAALLLPSCSGKGQGGDGFAGGDDPPTFEADLRVKKVTFGPFDVDAGESILVTDVVRNNGVDGVGAFRVGIYLSEDQDVDPSDLLLGFRTLPGLDPNSEDTGGGELTIPIQTPSGTYWVGAIADDLGAVTEYDEDNNVTVATGSLDVSAALYPDLAPTDITFGPDTVDAGQPIQIEDVIENQGQAGSGPFQVGFYLSSDPTITTADTLIGVRLIAGLAPLNSDQGSGMVTVPSTTPGGFYYLGVIADDTDAVLEETEFNNALAAGLPLEVTVPPLPDVVPTHIQFLPTAIDAGDPILVSEGVLNQGTTSTGTFQIGVYLSTDPLVDGGDLLLGYRTLASLADGAGDQVQDVPLMVPPDTAAGEYWIYVWVDDSELIPESVELNNTLVATSVLTVDTPVLPNLRPVAIDFTPNVVNVQDGDLLTISEEVENIGTEPSAAFRVGVYLSTNSVVTPADVLITSRVVTALGPGATSGVTKDVILPGGLADGSYFVGVIVDDLADQDETNEGDNVLTAADMLDVVSTPNPQPDLIMEQCSYLGDKKAPGETFDVVTRVTNEGDLSTDPFHVGIYLSDDATIDSGDLLLGERFLLGGLSAGFSNLASTPVTVPEDQPEGIYYLGAYADNQFVVAELDEDDNAITAAGTLEIEIPPPPPAAELYVVAASHDGGVHFPGDTITVDDVVGNQGNLNAGAFRVGYYLSADVQITTGDVLLGTRTVASLDVGQEDPAATLLTIPPGTAPGEYWVGIIVDDLDAVTENDEDDNDHKVDPSITIQ
jgi:subtilase family serine protease